MLGLVKNSVQLRLWGGRSQAELGKELQIAVALRIWRGEEPRSVEDGIGPGKEAERLCLLAHVLAPGGKPHHRSRQHDARDRDGTDEVDRLNASGVRQRRP